MIGRRVLIQGGVAAIAGAVVAACSKKTPASCTDAPGLTADEAQIRATVAYVEPSPQAEKRCETCRQYVPPSAEGSCGGCKVVKGPIHPNGTCKVYGAKD
jgi:hypothetical protein